MRKQALAATLALALVVTAAPVQTQALDTTGDHASDTQQGLENPVDVDGYYYGTVNMEYADFFYGELTDNEASTATAPALKEDKVADYRSEGMYDAVTSATSQKSTRYDTSYYMTGVANDEGDSEDSTNLYGIKDVKFKVSVELYNSFMAEENQDNKIYEYLDDASWSAEAFTTEYKVLNADGTFSKMISDEGELLDEDAAVAISLATTWGDYQVSIDNLGVPKLDANGNVVTTESTDRFGNSTTVAVYDVSATTQNLYGIIVEDINGQKYGMLHSDNTWLQTQEFAWAVEDEFSIHGENHIPYKRTDGLKGGNTITKITYLLKDSADLVVETNTYIKKLIDTDTYGFRGENAVYADGAEIVMEESTPKDSHYSLASVSFGGKTLTSGVDYTYQNNVLQVKVTENTGIGTYTLTYCDDNYGDITAKVQFVSSMTADQISIQDNKIVITAKDVAIADYVAAIDGISVNGNALRGTTGIINPDGTINFDAKISFHGNETIVFPEDGEYKIEITSAGYPAVSGTVVKGAKGSGDTNKDQNNTQTTSGNKGNNNTKTPVKTPAPTKKPSASQSKVKVSPVKGLKVKAAKKKLKISWKKNAKASGYQIQYSTSKKFKKATKLNIKKVSKTSATIKKLKAGKKYYVRIRAYKTVSGNKKYSAWSAVKSAKVKK